MYGAGMVYGVFFGDNHVEQIFQEISYVCKMDSPLIYLLYYKISFCCN